MNEFSMQIEPLSCCCCSSELRSGCDIALEGSVVDFGTVVVQEWHHWLVHGTVPLHISWLSVSVPVDVLMVLVIDWLLASPPLTVGIWDWWVLWQNTSQSPVAQIWVVFKSSLMDWVIIENDWTIVKKTTATSSAAVVNNPSVGKSTSSVEVLDWKLTDCEESKSNSELSSSSVVCEVEV